MKLTALRLLGRRKLTGQFDELCAGLIRVVLETAITAIRRGEMDKASAVELLESAFEQLKTHQRLVRAYMVIDFAVLSTGREVALRGVINVQPMEGDGYSRYQFDLSGDAIYIVASQVRPRYA